MHPGKLEPHNLKGAAAHKGKTPDPPKKWMQGKDNSTRILAALEGFLDFPRYRQLSPYAHFALLFYFSRPSGKSEQPKILDFFSKVNYGFS